MKKSATENQKNLSNMTPAANDANLGLLLAELIAAHNALLAKHNALCAKLDLDASVTDTDYASLTGSTDTVGDLGSRSPLV